jgi:hypothetical protein
MRIARMVPLVALLALPLFAQEPALDARLVYSGFGTPSFEINKPAYVALFEVSASGVMQLYPSRTSQLHQLMGEGRTFFSPQDMAFIERMNQGFMFDPFSQSVFASNYSMHSMYSMYSSGYSIYSSGGRWSNTIFTYGRRGLFLVVSSEPLALGAPITTQIRLNHALYAQGHHFDLNRESGLDALTALVTSTSATAEIATDFVPILEQYGTLADGFFSGYETYLTNCGRFGAIPVIDAWRYGALCSAGVIVQAVPPLPATPGTPGTPAPGTPGSPVAPGTTGGCGPQYGSEIVPCTGSTGGTVGPQGEVTRISDPERIRAFLDEMRDRSTGTPSLAGAAIGDVGSGDAMRGRDARGREASAPSIGVTRTLDNLPAPSQGSGTARNSAPSASAPHAWAPRNDQPRAEPSGASMSPPDRSPAPRTMTAPSSSPSPSPASSSSAPRMQASPASSPSPSAPAPPPKP